MSNEFDYIIENYKRIQFDIEEAKAKYRSPDDEIRFMAVTKTIQPEAINAAIECGIRFLGENRVQEYLEKKDFYSPEAEVHFIGHLQTNKVKYIVDSVSMIQSVDSLKLAEEVNRQAEKRSITKDILIEVNIGGEESKSGVSPPYLEELLYSVSQMGNIKIKGLMTIPPKIDAEKYFYKMNQLFIDICEKKIDNIDMSVLSMGMSADYATAIKYGSNLIRVGTKLFGARK